MAKRVRFNFLNNQRRAETELLTLITGKCPDVLPTDCHVTKSFGLVTFFNTEDVETVLLESNIELFNEINLQPIPPKLFNVERTIFISNVKHYVTKATPQQLISNFNHSNDTIKAVDIQNITNDNNNRIVLKIILRKKEMVDQAIIKGVWLQKTFLEQKYINKEKFESIKQCFKCFKYTHFTNKCPRDTPLCSICSGEHHYKDCPDTSARKCINCKGAHIAISRLCPVRQQSLKTQNATPEGSVITQTTTNVDLSSAQQFPTLSRPVPKSSDSNNITSTNSNQINLAPSPRTCNHNNFKEHEWEIQLFIAKAYAEMEAKGNPAVFLNIMNKFLVNNGLSPVIIHTPNQNINNLLNSNPPSPVPSSPLLFSEAVSTDKPSKDITPPITPITNSYLFSNEDVPNRSLTKSTEDAPLPHLEHCLSPISSIDSHSPSKRSIPSTSPLMDSVSDLQIQVEGTSLGNNIIISHNKDSGSPPQIHIPASTSSTNSQFSLRLDNISENDRTQISPASSHASLTSDADSEKEEDNSTPIDSTSESQLISMFPGHQRTPPTVKKQPQRNNHRETTTEKQISKYKEY